MPFKYSSLVLLSMLLCLVQVVDVWAAPHINNVSSSQPEKLLINGTGFGIHPDNSPGVPDFLNTAWHNFEDGNVEGGGLSLGNNELDANWSVDDSELNRSNSHYFSKKSYVVGRGGCLGIQSQSENYTQWYWTFYFYRGAGLSKGKFSRVWGDGDPTRNVWFSTDETDRFCRYFEGVGAGCAQCACANLFEKEHWYRVEIFMDRNAGTMSAWVDGDLQWTQTGWIPANWLVQGHTWEVGGQIYAGGGFLGFDDVYFDNTRARVEIGNVSSWEACTHREIQLPTAWSDNSITITVNQSSFKDGDTAYLFVVDADGNVSNGYPITIGGGGGEPQDNPPSVSITNPTNGDTYSTSSASVTIAGNASDDNGISSVAWSNNRGGSGTATNSSGDWSDWSINGIALQEGENVITITATDTNNQSAMDTITVTYAPSDMVQAWSANDQTNDNDWKDSSVTYCVRLLIEGAQVTRSGNQIMLGFKGRSSEDYTIRKVSIAEKDLNGGEGDVIDSTWTKVTFDGKDESTWESDVITVPAGGEKLSNPINFPIQAGKDYYVTFKVVTPSVYLNPPAYYTELYFYSDDHTDDVDWSENGHATTQDYHAFSAIYVMDENSIPPPPSPVQATPTNSIEITWGEVASAAGYNIYRSTTSGFGYQKLNNTLITGTTYHDQDTVPGTTYYYVVTSVSAAGLESSYSEEASATETLNRAPSISSFSATPNPADNPGETTTFNISATDPDGDSLTYTINFGDGTANGHGSQVVHTYEAKGTYTATVTVSDGHGHSVSETLQMTVNDIPPAKPTNVSAN